MTKTLKSKCIQVKGIAKRCIGVAEFATDDLTFDSVEWLASIDVSYNAATNQTTLGKRQHSNNNTQHTTETKI